MRVSAPPFRQPLLLRHGHRLHASNLIAANHTVEEIAEIIGVDSLGYLSVDDVVKLADSTQRAASAPPASPASYPTAIPSDERQEPDLSAKISERREGGACDEKL